ncbi:hypothetical protein DFH27DRAFT_563104 [Peziza echinospora]|nr:hypothetical protein DFH27DRAFT_563104 [Peziza echinospora]
MGNIHQAETKAQVPQRDTEHARNLGGARGRKFTCSPYSTYTPSPVSIPPTLAPHHSPPTTVVVRSGHLHPYLSLPDAPTSDDFDAIAHPRATMFFQTAFVFLCMILVGYCGYFGLAIDAPQRLLQSADGSPFVLGGCNMWNAIQEIAKMFIQTVLAPLVEFVRAEGSKVIYFAGFHFCGPQLMEWAKLLGVGSPWPTLTARANMLSSCFWLGEDRQAPGRPRIDTGTPCVDTGRPHEGGGRLQGGDGADEGRYRDVGGQVG